jgi:hypothetical protein
MPHSGGFKTKMAKKDAVTGGWLRINLILTHA